MWRHRSGVCFAPSRSTRKRSPGARETKFRCKSGLVMESLTLSFSISYLLWLTVDKPSGMVDAARGNLRADAAVVAVGTKTYIESKKAKKNTDLGIIPSGGVQRGVKTARRASANQRKAAKPRVPVSTVKSLPTVGENFRRSDRGADGSPRFRAERFASGGIASGYAVIQAQHVRCIYLR